MNNSDDKRYVTVEEASRKTGIPIMRLLSLIVLNRVNGIAVGNTGFIQASELKHLR